jgi:uncharacterized protein YecE (DUF72 family)
MTLETDAHAREVRVSVHIGTSGWQYKHWLGRFYPRDPSPEDDLAFYAARFQTVEINYSFYRLPEAETFAGWARRVPEHFIFAVKASRFLTHLKRLADPEEPVQRLMSRASRLGAKLGPVLLQLPPDMRRDTDRLRGALVAFGRDVRIAVEFRHESWFTEDVRALLSEHNAALCWADRWASLQTPTWKTADWGYIRFHGGLGTPDPCYGPSTMEDRARLVADTYGPDATIFAYFNNDPEACALIDAYHFAEDVRRAGLLPTRTAEWWEIRVGTANA